jgi:hypothetical protein
VFGEIKAEKEVPLAYAGYGGLGKQDGHIGKARKYLTKPLKIFERLGGSITQQFNNVPLANKWTVSVV